MFWLNRWDPVDRWFGSRWTMDRAIPETPRWQPVTVFPALNVWEDGDNLYVEAELPGLSSEDLEIAVSGDELTVKGSRKSCNGEGAAYHRRERANIEFSRTVTLPSDVEDEKVQAAMADGVLTLTLPKSAATKARRIAVQAS